MLERSIETHNALAAINTDEASPFLDSVVEHGKDASLTELKRQLNDNIASLSNDSPAEAILELRNRIAFATAFLKDAKSKLDESVFVPWLVHNGSIEVGDKRYFAGFEKKTKVVNQRKAIEAALDAVAGDMDRFCELFASDALKQGACKEAMGEQVWHEHFITTEEKVVKEGKPQKRVIELDKRFVK